jgi:glycosyltransferase involved in cell wall biosynthesis
MKISVVIPAFNEAANIGPCLDSVTRELARWAVSREVIVVDNASSDGTAEVARRYTGVTIVTEPRKGITFARQAGFARSTGDLIANIDADTRVPPGWLDTVIREFTCDAGLVCLSGPHRYAAAPWWVRLSTHLFYGIAFVTYVINRYVLRTGSMVQGGNFVCRRTALQQIGGFDTTIDFYGEDTDIAQRLHRVGRVKFTLRLPITASPRRLLGEGLFTTGVRYAVNYFWIVVSGRPFTRVSRDIRPS